MIHKRHTMNELAIIGSKDLEVQKGITEDLYRRYIAFIDAKPKTIETYTRALKQFFKYTQEHGISNPTREDVIAYRESLKETCKPSTVQNYIIALRQFFKWTDQEGLYKNVAENVKGAKLSKDHKKDYLSGKQVKGILDDIDLQEEAGKRDYAIFALMVTGGLRTIEVARANVEDIRVLGGSAVLFIQGKGGASRAAAASCRAVPTLSFTGEQKRYVPGQASARSAAGEVPAVFPVSGRAGFSSRYSFRETVRSRVKAK